VCSIVEVDLSQPLPSIKVPDGRAVLVVAWLCGEPIGMSLRSSAEARSPKLLAKALNDDLGQRLAEVAERHGLPDDATVTIEGLAHADCDVRAHRQAAARDGAGISVVLCTRDRPDSLRRCLDSLLASDFHQYEVIVVDNAPATAATQQLCREYLEANPHAPMRYVLESRAGLSRARNAGVAAAKYELIAFVDDDERVERNWLTSLSVEFEADPLVGCVSGAVLPAELDTVAQVNFEQFGGHSKGRGFERVLFDQRYLEQRQSAMYPLPPFGVGANMAFRRQALREIGGFDVALGAGTPTKGAEDTRAFSELLLAGWRMVYCPAAVTWHYHRSDDDALVDQLTGYGLGLGAYYAALLTRDPRRIIALLRLLPRALHDLSHPDSPRNASLGELPPGVARANTRLLLAGPFVYWRERLRARLLPA